MLRLGQRGVALGAGGGRFRGQAVALDHGLVGEAARLVPRGHGGVAFGDGLREDDWKDVFVAWTPSKHLSLTLAWVDLGVVVPALTPKRQSGAYISAQVAF
jgi:hypothetical protein